MSGIRMRGIVAAMAVMLGAGQGHAAANDCWSPVEIEAAKVRDLQTMLMVAALRCHRSGIDVLADYNRFVTSNRAALVAVNSQLKIHFVRADGAVAGQRGYDRFATALANAYGSGGSGGESCADMAEVAREGSRPGSSLLHLAEQRGLSPALPTTRCPEMLAAK